MTVHASESSVQVESRTPLVRLGTPLLSLHEVTKRWNHKRPPVLDGVSLLLEPGMLVGLVGSNGVGKTTLLRIAAGLIGPDEGIVRVDGLHPRRDRREYQRRLGFASAGSVGLYARLSARRHLGLWARLAMLDSAAARDEAVERTLQTFELGEFAERRVDRLSMGQRQRVRLAMAFLHEPKLVLLDEPWNSLDPEAIALLRRVLVEFVRRGGTAVCCTPTGEELGGHASEVYRLEQGRLHRL